MGTRKFIRLAGIAWGLMLAAGCSVEKNTAVSRAYHNITSRWNVYFNGNESFEKGRSKIDNNAELDFSDILPVFLYGNPNTASLATTEMDRAISKSSKLISLHSITAKPRVKGNGELSPAQREFYNRKEYNLYVDDAYLLMGKAHFYKMDYDQAAMVFRQIIKDFGDQEEAYESQVWLARIDNETGQYKSSQAATAQYENNAEFPAKLNAGLYATMADCYLKQKDYLRGIAYLEKALGEERNRQTRVRYLYILGQLYEKTGDLGRSSDYYGQVIRMNPEYDMSFHAHINRALVYQEGTGDAGDIENELRGMLRDDKNNEYQDQIYYALGDLYTKQGDTAVALQHYKRSVLAGIGNDQQKKRSYTTIAGIYYAMPDYILAQAYYDSVLTFAAQGDEDYDMLRQKSASLSGLVDAIRTVELEDSVQLLAALGRDELYRRIDAIIETERKLQEEEQQRQREEQLDRQYAGEVMAESRSRLQDVSGSSNWYFYNENAKSLGYAEFKVRWGNRRLEDHWQRADKNLAGFIPEEMKEETADDNVKEDVAELPFDRFSRQAYLRNIPLTDSALAASHSRIERSLYDMGLIYKDDMKDHVKAGEAFRELVGRYPQSEYAISAWYNLYSMAREDNNIAMEDYYKNLIINRFPETMYAKVLINPSYAAELDEKRNRELAYYEETYGYYKAGNYAEVISRSGYALANFSEGDLMPMFAYLGVLAEGRDADRAVFRSELQSLIARYPDSEVADDASQLVARLDVEDPLYAREEQKAIAEKLYRWNELEVHYFIFFVDRAANNNQLIFNIINFNLDNYGQLNLDIVTDRAGGQKSLVRVGSFSDLAAAREYMERIGPSAEVRRDLAEGISLIPAVISESNYDTLMKDLSGDRYMEFFNENYR